MTDSIYSRQSFLGENSEQTFSDCRAAIIGLGGGGSHIAQQLAHLGVGCFYLIDPDRLSLTNLNRTVGATLKSVLSERYKVLVLSKLIRRINPKARVFTYPDKWEKVGHILRTCDVIFGCVDTYSVRNELEGLSRRYLIPYIDIGMDVHTIDEKFQISGQMILSMPGEPCMKCLGFITDNRLKKEAADYGAAGGKPQVIWPNGILASLAIGTFVKLFSPWFETDVKNLLYLEYDGNAQITKPSNHLLYYEQLKCLHYPAGRNLGDPFWQPVKRANNTITVFLNFLKRMFRAK